MDQIRQKARKLRGKRILVVNSTRIGGGVAEILEGFTNFIRELEIQIDWAVLPGTVEFFRVTKKIHNALQGSKNALTANEKHLHQKINEGFAATISRNYDLVVVHDPQPLPLIRYIDKRQPWVFRCHIDLSSPNRSVWKYIAQDIRRYDHYVVSKKDYLSSDIMLPHSIIEPVIDPLSAKNIPLSTMKATQLLKGFDIPHDAPLILNVSRIDKWKDQIGVITVFERVRKHTKCKLIFIGSFSAADDPEAYTELTRLKDRMNTSPFADDIVIVVTEGNNDLLVNAAQRETEVVIQKSTKEGFGLIVAEALYKQTPVVASRVGGIPLQVIHGKNGFLHAPHDFTGFSRSILRLLHDAKLRRRFGRNGYQHIKKHFLLPRLVLDWLTLFGKILT